MTERPDPPPSRTTGQNLPQRTVGVRHDQLTNAALAAWFGTPDTQRVQRKPRACRGFKDQ
jgi:hypothetical protein